MARKKRCPSLKTDERPRHELQTFKVRCSLETAFYAFVKAHDADEAVLVAENWCRESEARRGSARFWDLQARHRHPKFEAEEA